MKLSENLNDQWHVHLARIGIGIAGADPRGG